MYWPWSRCGHNPLGCKRTMREHIAIRDERYVAGTKEAPEVGVFTQTHAGRHPTPWGRIAPGELVWMKWSDGGPVVATSRVFAVAELEDCDAARLREEVAPRYRLYHLDDYWEGLRRKGRFDAIVVRLRGEQWLEELIHPHVPNRESWVVLDSEEKRRRWLEPEEEAGRHSPSTRTKQRKGTRRVSAGLRFQVFRRDGFRCVYCGRGPDDGIRLQADHVVPWSKGGPTELANLRTSCKDCNIGKGASSL